MITSDTTLTSDLVCSGTALQIRSTSLILDLGGHTVSGDGSGFGVVIGDFNPNPPLPVTVTNGTIRGFEVGISIAGSDGGTLSNLAIADSAHLTLA